MKHAWFMAAGVLLAASAWAADDVSEVFRKGDAQWSQLVEDTGAGTVAAAGMLGIDGQSVATVENVKGLVASLKNLNINGSKGTLALGITPARTAFAPMDLSTYAGRKSLNGTLARIVGSTGIGYAQGGIKVGGSDFDRRAVSLQTSWYLRETDDPVLAVALGLKDRCTDLFAPGMPEGSPSAQPAVDAETPGPAVPKPVDPEPYKKRFASCTKPIVDGLKWNRSIAALSVARGWIRRSDNSAPEQSLGTAWTANLTLGFNPSAHWFDHGLALTLGHRRTRGEPVLSTLTSGNPVQRNTSLTLLRLTGGSEKARFFLEGSNARAADITESQRNFKRAVGLDMLLVPDVWLNLRVGRHHAINGGGQETTSLLSLSWSPKALMDVGSGN